MQVRPIAAGATLTTPLWANTRLEPRLVAARRAARLGERDRAVTEALGDADHGLATRGRASSHLFDGVRVTAEGEGLARLAVLELGVDRRLG